MPVPPWLEKLLGTNFFSVCRTHVDAARSECNMYCLDCNAGAFCFYCRSSKHRDHQVIQIRRSSYHDVVRVSEIQRVLDISGVQTYVINSARVLFLNERPQPKAGKAVSHVCQICGRSLLDTFRFCSLGCKLVGIKGNGDASFTLDSKDHEVVRIRQRDEGVSSSSSRPNNFFSVSSREEVDESSHHDICPPTPPNPNARRRKGIPQRAPFRS
ncbi:PLATZ transcription factor family protein [Striga hermonthica]|uniref:PLATZ transcription factor family protein n=1 Tax=Striga hermonthica TaxID=68872 RepID=A0A9N7NJQ3_STRHE|nr:PLATZ transcription factor family protein [Striga hermonthica]